MRLWHDKLLPYLPNKQLLGQHRECCALRGNGWGKKHSTVDYVFKYDYEFLYKYHMLVIDEMKKRGYKADELWLNCRYRGKNCEEYVCYNLKINGSFIYNEHNKQYITECIDNLKRKNAKPLNHDTWDEILYLI